MHILRHALAGVVLLTQLTCGQRAPAEQTAAAEQAAFAQARAQMDPAARIAALEAFLRQFPQGTRADVGRRLLLTALLTSFPERTGDIHNTASAQLHSAASPIERWTEEARLANLLADAGTGGADLPDAALWAADAVRSMTESAYRHQLALAATRFHLPALSPRQVRSQFAADRALALTAAANVHLRQGKASEAAPLLAAALTLSPLSPEANRLGGERLLAASQPRQALDAYLRADALGPLPVRDKGNEWRLFQELEHGDETALALRVDGLYRELFPVPFTLPRRAPLQGGHPALLELFTGSDCLPCTGADIAVDSLLHTYGSSDMIALSYDEHIPFPDPLATPETVARGATYGVGATPSAFLDGTPLQILGSTRADVENIVLHFALEVEDWAAIPSGVTLQLKVDRLGASAIHARVQLAFAPARTAGGLTTGNTSLRTMGDAQLHLALAQDDMRYSGRNGVRLHRMVVRALQTLPAPNALAAAASATFDLAEIEAQHVSYLTALETHNDEFGAFHFRQTSFPLASVPLFLVAWVEDPTSHRVLQSASAAVPDASSSPAPTGR